MSMRWGRREAAQGAPAALLPEARRALSEDGTGAGPPPQRAAGGGAKRGSGAREERRPAGTEASTPGVLTEPEVQVGAVTVGYVAAPGPLLSTPLLADTAAGTVDARTVKHLLHAALKKEEEEKEERKKAKEERRLKVTALLAVPIALRTPVQQRRIMALSDEVDAEALSSQSGRRKSERRKKKSPKTSSSRSSGVRTRRCEHGCALSPWFGTHVFIAVLQKWPRPLAIMAAVCAWLVLRVLLLALCSFLRSSGPRCSTPWPV